jgi:hypothetical protein
VLFTELYVILSFFLFRDLAFLNLSMALHLILLGRLVLMFLFYVLFVYLIFNIVP